MGRGNAGFVRADQTSTKAASGEPVRVDVPKPARLDSIDLLRGLAMVIMALDHVRDYFTDVRFDPLDIARTTPLLFFTRWITHHSAPVFVFLAGTGAFLSLTRGRTKGQVAKFLLTRGIWLVILEVTVVRYAWLFNLDYSFVFVQVIWVIGWSMIVLSLLIFLPDWAIALVSLGMIALHNLADPISPSDLGSLAWLWQVLHVSSFIKWGSGNEFMVGYPLIPWIGVMGAGYLFGNILLQEKGVRRRKMYTIGFLLIAGFIFLRALNIYGDPQPWTVQNTLLKTFMSFIDTSKYPPSLLYLMMTLGPAIVILPRLERWEGKFADFIVVFGRIPLFYYILHLYLIHGLAVLAAHLTVHDVSFLFQNILRNNYPRGFGFNLGVIYLVWVAVILLLYPLCSWFAGVKRKSHNPVLSYL